MSNVDYLQDVGVLGGFINQLIQKEVELRVKEELAKYQYLLNEDLSDKEELLTVKEVAVFLKINRSTVYRRTKSGELKKYVNGRSVYYKRSEVEQSLLSLTA